MLRLRLRTRDGALDVQAGPPGCCVGCGKNKGNVLDIHIFARRTNRKRAVDATVALCGDCLAAQLGELIGKYRDR